MADSFLDQQLWQSNGIPGEWHIMSSTAQERIERLSNRPQVFGKSVDHIRRYIRDGLLIQITIVFLEEGNFVGYRDGGAVNAEEERNRGEQFDTIGQSVQERKKAFEKKFRELSESLPTTVARVTRDKGRQITIGQGDLRKRILQFTSGELVLNLDMQPGHLVALTILRSENFNRRMRIESGNSGNRRAQARSNVEVLTNGDSVIQNIPMIEQGSRGYCAIGTLTMITRYYGLALDIDSMAAAAGYSEGGPQNATIEEIYQAAARQGRIDLNSTSNFSFKLIKRSIDRGEPVLVWRWFSRERNAFHSNFAERFAVDPNSVLPNLKERNQPPLPQPDDGGHASLITGYNQQRGEILFTESWRNEFRQRRMLTSELEKTSYHVFFFKPRP